MRENMKESVSYIWSGTMFCSSLNHHNLAFARTMAGRIYLFVVELMINFKEIYNK